MSISSEDFLLEYKHTWVRHRGSLSELSRIFDMTPRSMKRKIERLRQKGYDLALVNDVRETGK